MYEIQFLKQSHFNYCFSTVSINCHNKTSAECIPKCVSDVLYSSVNHLLPELNILRTKDLFLNAVYHSKIYKSGTFYRIVALLIYCTGNETVTFRFKR